ncbi:MAG: ABC transporter substrate-binding protein [Cyanobacteriota bacterium]
MRRRSFLAYSMGAGVAAASAISLRVPFAVALEGEGNLVMQLDWKFNVQFAGLLLADHLGLYADKGLEVVIKPWESNMVVPETVAASSMMIGCAEQNLILEAQAEGASLKALATMFQASPYALMTMPDSGLTTLQDLVGKTVGVHVDGVKVMELVKGVNNIAPDAIKVIEIPYEDKIGRLIRGELAALQCYAVDEPIAFANEVGKEPILLPMDAYGYDAYAQTFFTTDAMLAAHGDMVKAFLEASFAGWAAALADIPGTATLVAEKYAEPGSKYTDVGYQTRSLELVAEYVLRGISSEQLGVIDGDRWMLAAERMAEYGIISAAPSREQALNLSLWSGMRA